MRKAILAHPTPENAVEMPKRVDSSNLRLQKQIADLAYQHIKAGLDCDDAGDKVGALESYREGVKELKNALKIPLVTREEKYV